MAQATKSTSSAELRSRLDRTDSTDEATDIVAELAKRAQVRMDTLKKYDRDSIVTAVVDMYGYDEAEIEGDYPTWGELVDYLSAEQQEEVIAYLSK